MSEARRHDWIALTILTSLITLLFIDVLAGVHDLYQGDLFRYSYPYKKVLRDVVLGGEFPYWNRAFSGGQPMAANPAHAAFYPLTWLILLPGFAAAFQWLIVIHLYGAAWSMYALLRSLALSPPASFLGALSFVLGGVVLSYLTLLPFLTAVVWLPLTLLFARRFLLHRARRDFVLAGVFLAMQLLIGEPTTILQTGLLLLVYAIYRRGLRGAGAVAVLVVTALCLAAIAVLPAIDHAADSVRARGFPYETVTDWSMPPTRLAELWGLTPSAAYARGFPFLASIYPGLLVSVLAAAGIIARLRGSALALALVAASVLLAVGDFTPLWRWLHDLGLARSIRYPEKFILTAIFVATVFAAKTLDVILQGDQRVRRSAIGVAALVLLLVLLTPVRAVLLLLLLITVARAPRRIWLAATGAFVLLDLGLLVPELAPRTDPAFLRDPPAVLRNLPPNRGDYRVFHHAAWHRNRKEIAPFYQAHPDVLWVDRNAAAPMTPIAHGVQLALDGDYDYTALLPSADFHSVVRNELPNVRPDWLEVAAAMSNVWYRVVYVDPRKAIPAAGGGPVLVERWASARRALGTRMASARWAESPPLHNYRNVQPVGILRLERTPRYRFADRLETARDRAEFVRKLAVRGPAMRTAYIDGAPFPPAPGVVHRVTETANTATIEVETSGRAFLMMSVTPHKYWRITIDGREAPAIVTNVGHQGVVLPTAGRHVVEMRYRNPLIATGAAISLVSLLVLLGLASRPITMRAL